MINEQPDPTSGYKRKKGGKYTYTLVGRGDRKDRKWHRAFGKHGQEHTHQNRRYVGDGGTLTGITDL